MFLVKDHYFSDLIKLVLLQQIRLQKNISLSEGSKK